MTFTARDLSPEEMMRLKPKGFYRIETFTDAATITVHRPGEPIQIIRCLSQGHANQVRQHLTDEGLAGFIADAQ